MIGLGVLFLIFFLLLIIVVIKYFLGGVKEVPEENFYETNLGQSLYAILFPVEISVIFLLMIFIAAFCSDAACLLKIFYVILPVIISLCYVYKDDILNPD